MALAAALGAALLLAGCGSSAPAAPGPSVGQQLDAPLPSPVAQADLRSVSGRHFTLAALHGKVLVISDMMTLCQETCPLDTANVVAAARAVERAGLGNQVMFLSITIDPTRDTVAQLAAYRHLYSPAPADWLTVTAAPATLSALWKQLGVYIQRVPTTPPAPRNWRTGQRLSYDLTHSDEVFFVDRQGHERFLLEGAPHVAAGAPMPGALKNFMDAKGHQNLTNPDPQAWTLAQELDVVSWLTGHHVSQG